MISITEKNNKIYIVQDSGEYEKSLATEILLLLLVTLAMRLVYLDSYETNGFLYLFIFFFFKDILILRKKTKIILDLDERNIITKKETFNFKNISKIDTKKIGYLPVSYGVEIYYDKKQKLLFNTCLENEAIEIIKTLKMFVKGEEDEKYIINFSEDSNKTIVTRYLKENFLMKSKFFILLYSIYLIYVRVYIYKFNLDISLMKKVSLETSFHFLVLYFIILLVKSKEIMILEKEEITIKKFFTFICYQTNKIKVSDIKSIYYETNSLTGKFNIFVDMTKNLKIRTKFKEFEDKIYYFGINLSEEEYKEIAGKILNCTDKINVLFIE